jgi:Zn-dependent protease with chaperone function
MSDDFATPPPEDPPPPRSTVGYPGRFADGKSAVIHEVRVQFGGDGIRIMDSAGLELEAWLYDDIRLVESLVAGRPARLLNLTGEMARLEIAGQEPLEILRRLAPDIEKTGMRDPAQWRRAAVWTVALGMLFGGVWWGLSSAAPLIAAMTPIEVEESIGKSTVEQVTLLFGGFNGIDELTCRRRDGLRALDAMTEQLTAVDDSPYDFKVRVLDIDIPNAFAAPGGYIVIFRGLIDLAESPDEVAGVLAHEMGHVTHRHSMTHLIRAIGFQTLIVPLISGGAMAADVLSEMGQAALQASYTRELEEDADRVAVDLMNRAGLKAATFTELLYRIEQKFGALPDEDEAEAEGRDGEAAKDDSFSIPDMMATHPSTPDRARMVRELAAPDGEAGLDEAQWQALRSICDSRKNRN